MNHKKVRSHNELICSVLCIESCSVTLTQTVIALQAAANSYCENLTQLGALLRFILRQNNQIF